MPRDHTTRALILVDVLEVVQPSMMHQPDRERRAILEQLSFDADGQVLL